ncbi:MAG: C1 family peptidase [Bdellovibrionales bacterium]
MLKRKLFLISALLLIPQLGFAWVASMGKVGRDESVRYQSSNPKVELKPTRSLNQASSEECYLFAFVGALEVANQNGWRRPTAPEISAEFLFMEKMKAWAKDILNRNLALEAGHYFHRGGDIDQALRLSVEEGLLPQELFWPKKEFAFWDHEQIYTRSREIVKESRSAIRQAQSEPEKQRLIARVLKKIEVVMARQGLPIPESFRWGSRTWTATQFEQAVGIKRSTQLFMMYPKGKWDMGDPWDLRRSLYELVEFFNGAFRYRQSSWSRIWDYIFRSIDQGLPTLLSMKWGNTYHVMNAVGYEYNGQNRVVAVKMKNSWGDEYGDRGYAYFQPADLEKHVTSIWGFWTPALQQ